MNHRHLFFIALLSATVFVGSAKASPVDFTGTDYEMGYVSPGQYGTINTTTVVSTFGGQTVYDIDFARGSLGSYGAIRFDYELTQGLDFGENPIKGPVVYASSTYNFSDSGLTYFGGANSMEPGIADISGGYIFDGSSVTPSNALVLVTANVVDETHGYTIIQNLTSSFVYFLSALRSGLSATDSTTTYNVAAVPLPAALPMFGAGLVSLIALRRRKAAGKTAA